VPFLVEGGDMLSMRDKGELLMEAEDQAQARKDAQFEESVRCHIIDVLGQQTPREYVEMVADHIHSFNNGQVGPDDEVRSPRFKWPTPVPPTFGQLVKDLQLHGFLYA
jgi:hypothetical protein